MKAKRCPICNTLYPSFKRECPNCFYKEPFDVNYILAIFLILAIIPLTYFHQASSGKSVLQKFENKTNTINSYHSKNNANNEYSKKIYLNSMSELSGLSKAEILDIRKKAVNNSIIFSDIKNYEPNSDVYKIQDNLPWISAYEISKNGTEKNLNIGVGASRHSTMIKNPEILLGYIIPEYNFKNIEPDEVEYFFPKKITWDEKSKTIKIYFDYTSFIKRHNYSNITVYTDDTNARDLGYNWIYCTKKEGAMFNAVNNISKVPYKLKGYYHRGFACGLESGCNNYSPMQSEMIFKIISKNAILKFKFWKNKPFTPLQKADINYEMHFE